MRSHGSDSSALTYVSLFSGAGIGCYGLSRTGFECIATVESLERRLVVQRHNKVCRNASGYICGDLSLPSTQDKIYEEIKKWNLESPRAVDVVVATPPCQGMSVCNHKKRDERKRNSLVVAAVSTVEKIVPKIFIFENTSLFLKTICDLENGKRMPIGDAIKEKLGKTHHIHTKVINLKNYGCPSSRTRTLVIGTHKKLWFSPLSIFPDWKPETTLREIIGDLPPLKRMGEICRHDIYHAFKPYSKHMRSWIEHLAEGQGAFDQKSIRRRPHKIINGVRIENKNVNGDKYKRQCWDAVPSCVHTRNDILASQNTIHPRDDRVFSIRELMRMMSIPDVFKWGDLPTDCLSNMPFSDRQKFLKTNEMNIRQCLGEAVPTEVIRCIAQKASMCIRDARIMAGKLKMNGYRQTIVPLTLGHCPGAEELMCSIELANAARSTKAAYYTPPVPAFKLMELMPSFPSKKEISILEPSAGIGRLLHVLPQVCAHYERVNIDAMDIDARALDMARRLAKSVAPSPAHISINYIRGDFLDYDFKQAKYDVIIGNPPFGKLSPERFKHYSSLNGNPGSRNVFAFFMHRAIGLAKHVVMIAPKSLLNAPDFTVLRNSINMHHAVRGICDFGEKGFEGVKIETIALAIQTNKKQSEDSIVAVESLPRQKTMRQPAGLIFDKGLPYWVIYRDDFFDSVLDGMECEVFKVFRDRQITKRHLTEQGKVRVLKSVNVKPLNALPTNKDLYVKNASEFAVCKFMNRRDVVLVPNLSYYPRACRMPENCIADGSVAILYPRNGIGRIKDKDIKFFSTEEFRKFYRVARNYGTRSLNIDSNSVFFFGVRK